MSVQANNALASMLFGDRVDAKDIQHAGLA